MESFVNIVAMLYTNFVICNSFNPSLMSPIQALCIVICIKVYYTTTIGKQYSNVSWEYHPIPPVESSNLTRIPYRRTYREHCIYWVTRRSCLLVAPYRLINSAGG